MSQKPKVRSLVQPKISIINKSLFRKFHPVREMRSQAIGQFVLASYNHKKYILKQFTHVSTFMSLPYLNQQIYHYADQRHNTYIFQLIGEPLNDLRRGYSGPEIKYWLQKCGGIQNGLLELTKQCIKLYEEFYIQDIIPQCWRVHQGKLVYWYYTWMRSSYDIVRKKNEELQNYYFSPSDLRFMQGSDKNPQHVTFSEYLFKIGLFILSYLVSETKTRNYQYSEFKLNLNNIEQKLKVYQLKATNRDLEKLLKMCIECNSDSMKQIWKVITESGTKEKIQMLSCKNKKTQNKENQIFQPFKKKGVQEKQQSLKISKLESVTSIKNSSIKQVKQRRHHSRYSLNESVIFTSASNILQSQNSKKMKKKGFYIKQAFKKPPLSCTTLIEYFGLFQHLTQSLYESNVIKIIEDVKIQPTWEHKIYPNGSIFLGNFIGDKRQGKGVYLFDSQDLFIGDWKDNFMSGSGAYAFKSGQMYIGQLKNGLKHGFGRFIYKDKKIYQGHWEYDQKFGVGSVSFPNGVKFIGNFNKSKEAYGLFTALKEGQIIEFQGNLESYNWQDNQLNGVQLSHSQIKTKLNQCRSQHYVPCIEQDSGKYYGQCVEDQPNGFGIKENKFEIWQGYWKDGKMNGQGKLKVKGKFQIKGLWEEGVMIQYNY